MHRIILSLTILIILTTACVPQQPLTPTQTAAPTATVTLTATATTVPPTPTPQPTPTETIALPPPTETWMGEFLANKEGYDYSFENGQWLMRSKPLTNGKTIDMFTYAAGEWQPTYDTLPNHVNEYFGLDLEAVAHQFVRYELTTDSEGNSIRTLNPDDLANLQALAETRWEERKEQLGSFRMRIDPLPLKSTISKNGIIIIDTPDMNNPLNGQDGRWEVLSAAYTGYQGKDQIMFIGTEQGLIPMLIVTNSGIVRTFPNGETAEPAENSTKGLIEKPILIEEYRFVFSAPPSDTINSNSVYTYSHESLDYMLSYVRGAPSIMPHLGELAQSGYFVELDNIIRIINQNNLIFVPFFAYSLFSEIDPNQ